LPKFSGARTGKDYGNIEALARSIDANGLLHPIVIHIGAKRFRVRSDSESKGRFIAIPHDSCFLVLRKGCGERLGTSKEGLSDARRI
jgi:hypothetical protein